MNNRIKCFLRRWPHCYLFLQRSYYFFRFVMEAYILGTKLQELIWKTRHIFRNDRWPQECRETIGHPRRQILIESISFYAPFDSILEIGCSSGANLHLLAKEYPYVQLYGIDINARAIREGNAYLKQQGIANVELFISRADKLKRFGDKTIDIVFTDATLMYIGVDKIRKVIEEMKRVSCKGIVLSEWHCEDNSRTHFWYDGHWVYDYKTLLTEYFCSDTVAVSRHPEDLWDDEAWRKFGSIIEVRL